MQKWYNSINLTKMIHMKYQTVFSTKINKDVEISADVMIGILSVNMINLTDQSFK